MKFLKAIKLLGVLIAFSTLSYQGANAGLFDLISGKVGCSPKAGLIGQGGQFCQSISSFHTNCSASNDTNCLKEACEASCVNPSSSDRSNCNTLCPSYKQQHSLHPATSKHPARNTSQQTDCTDSCTADTCGAKNTFGQCMKCLGLSSNEELSNFDECVTAAEDGGFLCNFACSKKNKNKPAFQQVCQERCS